ARSVTSATTPTFAYSPSCVGTSSTRCSSPTSMGRGMLMLGKTTASSSGINRQVAMICSVHRWLRLSNMSVCDYYRRMSNDASEAWTLLFRLFVSQRGRVPQVAAEFDLSPMQAHVLRLLEPDQPLPVAPP